MTLLVTASLWKSGWVGPLLGSGGYDVRMGRVLAREAVWAPKITGMKGVKQIKALDRERESWNESRSVEVRLRQ